MATGVIPEAVRSEAKKAIRDPEWEVYD